MMIIGSPKNCKITIVIASLKFGKFRRTLRVVNWGKVLHSKSKLGILTGFLASGLEVELKFYSQTLNSYYVGILLRARGSLITLCRLAHPLH